MGGHRLPTIANRLRRNRSFESAWYADGASYAAMLQKDFLLSKLVWSFVSRSSRSSPRATGIPKVQAAAAAAATTAKLTDSTAAQAPGAQGAAAASLQPVPTRDYPNLRTGRIFMQHLPYKSVASTFSYAVPASGPQAKYGLFPTNRPIGPPRGGSAARGRPAR